MPERIHQASPLHGTLLQAWECTVERHSAIYVSGPITTGPRFVEWCQRFSIVERNGIDVHSGSFRNCVVEPNERALRGTAQRLRKAGNAVVIEPTSLSVKEWKQEDYYLLWELVIERYVSKVVLIDGWEFSKGCVTETLFAHGLGVEVYDPANVLLLPQESLERIKYAETALRNAHTPLSLASEIRSFESMLSEAAK